MIDAHTYICNLAYVPVRGMLQARGVPEGLAGPAARIFDRLTRVDESKPTQLDSVLLGAFAPAIEVTTADLVLDIARALEATELDAIRDSLAEGAIYLDSVETGRRSDEYQVSLLLETELLGTNRERLARIVRAVGHFIAGGTDTLRWLLLMMNRESVIVERLLALWDGASVSAVHVADLEPSYPHERARFDFVQDQLPRVRRLAAATPGRLATFVGYNPARPDALDIVQRALDALGFDGVVICQPDEDVPGEDAAVAGAAPADVTERAMALFAMCVERDVPVLAPCVPSEVDVVLGEPGTRGGPAYWRRVLEMPGLESLRLCLAHAGGMQGWTLPHSHAGDEAWDSTWACEVVALCTHYPSVYCDFAQFSCVFDDEARAKFTRRLERVVEATAAAARPFSTRVLFGSGWHPFSRTPQHREFARVWRSMIATSPVLAPYEAELLTLNAARYFRFTDTGETARRVASAQVSPA